MRILPAWLREFVDVPADDRHLAEALTSAGIAVESVQEENGATVYEMDLTTNRVDAMNHYGVAREASAIYDVELKRVQPRLAGRTAGPSAPLGMTNMIGVIGPLLTEADPCVVNSFVSATRTLLAGFPHPACARSAAARRYA